ncbi:MAG: GNAT family N-acetyltransferase [Alphaproteobacteria bacterium]|nr:GNAT family N-acetyltransferase [Alphaproteobacteria bacterium]
MPCGPDLAFSAAANLRQGVSLSAPPLSRLDVPAEEADRIRAAVRSADLTLLGARQVLAGHEHVEGLIALFADRGVSDPIYDLPRPFTIPVIQGWVDEARARREAGEALLAVSLDEAGQVAGYSYFTIWPELSAAEIAGARRADLQNSGEGGRGAARSFGWMFEHLGVRLIGLTASLDNIRSARVIEAAGFSPMGERSSIRPDGSERRSRYWEMTRESWRERAGRSEER